MQAKKQTKKQKQPRAGVIYRGPSLINGQPIIAVAVFPEKGANAKTGAVVQTYILCDNGQTPQEANKTGNDSAICGDCPHKGTPNPSSPQKLAEGRTCYVQMQGVAAVYRSLKNGKYEDLTTNDVQALGRNRFVRLGSYGDPLAVPAGAWDDLLRDSSGHTAYTHQAQTLPDHGTLSRCMVSADNPAQAIESQSKGFRTFRVIPVKEWQSKQSESLLDSEIICPATNEGGNRTQCRFCKLCNGDTYNRGKSIAVVAHGATRNKVKG